MFGFSAARSPRTRSRLAPRGRRLNFEQLECRRLLAVAALPVDATAPPPPSAPPIPLPPAQLAPASHWWAAEGEGEDEVRFRLDVTDSSGQSISTIPAGSSFLLKGYVEDIRFAPSGVFSAYLDVAFDAQKATAVGPITFGDEYISGRNGSLTTPGLVDEIGGLGDITPLGGGEFALFSIPFEATAEGSFSFAANAADQVPLHSVFVYGSVDEIPESQIDFGTVMLTVLPTERRYDFGTDTSPLEPGTVRVAPGTLYNAVDGFGFLSGQSGVLDARDRGSASPPVALRRDLVFSSQMTFAVDLPAGQYDLTLTLGDQYPHDQMAVRVEGQTQAVLSNAANQFLTPTYRVDVTDGQLTLQITDQGGADVNAVINGLTIQEVPPDPGIAVTPVSGLITDEDQGQANFTVVLQTEPTADVTIPLASSDLSEGTVSPASLTFTTLDWNTPQLVTVTGVDDPDVDGPVAYLAQTLPAQSADLNYHGLDASDVGVTNQDNEVVPVPMKYDFGTAGSLLQSGFARVSPGTTYNANQGFGFVTAQSGPLDARDRGNGPPPAALTRDIVFSNHLTFAVDLPPGEYDVTPTLGDLYPHDQVAVIIEGQTQATLSTSANQFLSPTYRVTVGDGQLTFRLQDQGGVDSNAVLNGLSIVSLAPEPGITVSPTAGLVTSEDGNQASFTVVLDTAPSGDVTIALSSSDTSEGIVAPASLTFTDQDWNSPKTVTITGQDDPDIDGAVLYQILTAPAQSSDADYVNFDASDVSVTNQDNESPPVPTLFDFGTASSPLQSGYTRVTPTTAYHVSQGFGFVAGQSGPLDARDRGAGASPANLTRDLIFSSQMTFAVDVAPGEYDVTLTVGDQYPHDQVAVTIEGQTQATLSTLANQFLSPTYRVTVTDGQLTVRLQDQGGGDPNAVLNGLGIVSLAPQPGITVTPASGLVTGEDGTQDQFTVVLTSEPSGDVTIDLASSDTSEGTVSPSSLVFTALDWDTPQTVTVSGVDDPDLDGPIAYVVQTLAAQSTDTDYDGLDAVDVAVVNQDDESPPPPSLFDFGTAGSPLETGYTRITASSAYSPGLGYGLLVGQSGTLDSRDRGAGPPPTPLTRDLVFSTHLSFAVDVAPGSYDVTITLGDQYPHDQIGLSLEGVFRESLSNSANQFLTRSYSVTVNDGQLTLDLADLGGTDPNVVINGLRIDPSP